jgi:hypothetical protein
MTRSLLIIGFFTAVAFQGCGRPAHTMSTAHSTKPDKNRTQPPANPNAKVSATPAPAHASAAPKTGSRSGSRFGSHAVIKERVSSTFSYPTEAEAEDDVLNAGAEVIHRKLGELDPPVSYLPSPNEVKNEFLRRDSRAVRPLSQNERALLEGEKIDPNRVYVEYDVEVSADQIREMRTRERLGEATRLLGLLTAVAVAGFLFLRLDEHTGGYLTRWLAIGAIALAAGAAVGLYLL